MMTPSHLRSQRGNALLVSMVLLFLMLVGLEAIQTYTSAVAKRTGRTGQFTRTEAAAGAGLEIMFGRLEKWITTHNGYLPSDQDIISAGVSTIPTFPTGSDLANYTFTFQAVPVLPDDSYVSVSSNALYLPSWSGPARTSTAENSVGSPTLPYFTKTVTKAAPSIASITTTLRLTVSATPKSATLNSSGTVSVRRYMRCDKVSPFGWLSYQNGRKNGGGSTYQGPVYAATNLVMSYCTFTDSALYGLGAYNMNTDNWQGGGQAVQLHQITPFQMIPNLTNSLAVDSNGNRQASYETDTSTNSSGYRNADAFSTRELIEPPTNPSNDTTPENIKDRRIYDQADARVEILATTSNGRTSFTVNVLNVDGTTNTASWATALKAAFVPKATNASTPFYDRSRSVTAGVQVTDVNVGILKTVMEANPSAFPTGIIYAWDGTGIDNSTARPLTGMRIWNAGQLPDGGLTFGTNDPAYLRGDFNTGTTLKDTTNPESGSGLKTYPDSDNTAVVAADSSVLTTPTQRTTSGYTVQPGAVFGDSVTELSNAWKDVNSRASATASSTTINLVEGWSTMNSNELRADDTYLDNNGQANPVWLENWAGARRTMSGEEMVLWHSRYNAGANQGIGGGWSGDISYNSGVSNLPLNWGSLAFVRDRYARVGGTFSN